MFLSSKVKCRFRSFTSRFLAFFVRILLFFVRFCLFYFPKHEKCLLELFHGEEGLWYSIWLHEQVRSESFEILYLYGAILKFWLFQNRKNEIISWPNRKSRLCKIPERNFDKTLSSGSVR